jgi:UDP-2,4-diacetamido-2,4,6-trideoxy-beta-L-altropyranose hydrolase
VNSPNAAVAAIAFRTTAGKWIGFGHLRRCLTLAGELRAQAGGSLAIRFWIDGDPGALAVAETAGFEARLVTGSEPGTTATLIQASSIETLIVDSYDIQPETFSTWRPLLRGLVVLDDLADRFLDVDVVVNGSPQAASLSYRTGVAATRLVGPQYALLRPSFRDRPPHTTRPEVSRVLVTLGGADPHGLTSGVVQAVRRALLDVEIDVVLGPLFGPMPVLDRPTGVDPSRLQVYQGLDDLSALMAKADFAVSGGGQTLYELAASGIPTVALCLADNQRDNIAALAGVSLVSAGRLETASANDFRAVEEACRALAGDRALRATMGRAGQALMDGRGAARAADMILKLGRARAPADHGQI